VKAQLHATAIVNLFGKNLYVPSIGRWVGARHYLNASEKGKNVFILLGNEHRFRGCPARCFVATPSDWTFAVSRNCDRQTGRRFLSVYLMSHTGTSTDMRWNYFEGNRVEFKSAIYVKGVMWYRALVSCLKKEFSAEIRKVTNSMDWIRSSIANRQLVKGFSVFLECESLLSRS